MPKLSSEEKSERLTRVFIETAIRETKLKNDDLDKSEKFRILQKAVAEELAAIAKEEKETDNEWLQEEPGKDY